ncbi:MAG: ABC transporter ATP-binding protein [Candidatus Paceibacterota bacterium]|jgi:ABC-type multidrug transport system fused ATPase/permease subunit
MNESKIIENSQTMEQSETKRGLRAIFRHLKPFSNKLIIITILGIISAIANGLVPYVTGRFFDALIDLSEHKEILVSSSFPLWAILLFIWTITQLVANNVDWVNDRLRRNVGINLQFKIQVDGFIHMLKLPLAYHKNGHISGELQKISSASWRVQSIFDSLVSIAPQFLSIIIGITLSASINVALSCILLVGVILYVMLLIYILRPIAKIDSLGHKSWSDGWDDAATAVNQVESVKQSASEEYEIRKVKRSMYGKALTLWKKIEATWSNVGFFQRTIVFFTQLAIFILSVRFVSQGVITVGELMALNGYSMMFFGPFVSLGYSWQVIRNGIISAAQSEIVFDTKTENYTPENLTPIDKITGDIVFENVSFRYTPEQPDVLIDLNIHIHPGEIVAVVGESGVGKSTSISLISGYYFPTQGRVLIDGIDTRKLDLTNLRRHIAVVPQEVALFNDSIKINIEYGSFRASQEDIIRVAKEAHIDDFVQNLPEKYESLVGERGIKLSVGQKQRVSIARAILRNPAILILDEPTSALDANTEQIVTEALEKLMRGKTTFIIAHRLSTVRKAHKILVFDKGRMVECGTHDELIKIEDGVYKKLYDYQIGLH